MTNIADPFKARAKATGKSPSVDFDWRAVKAVDGDLHRGWKQVHDLPDIFWTPHYGGHWVMTRADDLERLYRDQDSFSSSDVTIPPMSTNPHKTFKVIPAESDPPITGDYRQLLAPAFTAAKLKQIEDHARKLATSLFQVFRERGCCDFVPDFAQHYPIEIFLTMVDLPLTDAAKLLPLVDGFVRGKDMETRNAALQSMMTYIREKLSERTGGAGQDIISQLTRAQVEGRPISPGEALGACANLLFAGLDTVVAASCFFMRFLAVSPDHRLQLQEDPALIPRAVEELLRYHGLTNLARRVTKDIEIKDTRISAGDMVMAPLALHGLDERRWPDPMRIDFHRNQGPVMIFGTGAHMCLGNRLARLELRILLETCLNVVPDFHITSGAKAISVSSGVNAMISLPLTVGRCA